MSQSASKKLKYMIPFLLIVIVMFIPVFSASGTGTFRGLVRGMIRQICEIGMSDKVREILIVVPWEEYPEVWSIVTGITDNVITPIAYAVLGIYFVTSLVNLSLKFEGFSVEIMIKPFVRYVIAFVCVRYVPAIASGAIALGAQFIGTITDSLHSLGQAGVDETSRQIYSLCSGSMTGIFASLAIMLQLAIPYFLSLIIGLFIQIMAYGVVIEIFVSLVFMPLTFGDIVLHGFDGSGFRYVKRFIALCLQGGIILIISSIAGQFALNWWVAPTFDEAIKGMMGMIVAEGACAALIAKTGNLSREIVGV